MSKSPQMKNWEKRIARGVLVVRAALDPAAGEGDASAAWLSLKEKMGGAKPALLALLRGKDT